MTSEVKAKERAEGERVCVNACWFKKKNAHNYNRISSILTMFVKLLHICTHNVTKSSNKYAF